MVINADNSLTAVAGSNANIEGRNITLSTPLGAIGSESAPVRLSARYALQPNGLVSGGVVNVGAQNDIGLTQMSGDLLIGSIESAAGGNLFVNVPNGTVYGAAGQTAAQALSDAQVRGIWQNLKLTAAYGAETNVSTAASVQRFEAQVKSQYQQYWQLLGKGTVDGGGLWSKAGALDPGRLKRPERGPAAQGTGPMPRRHRHRLVEEEQFGPGAGGHRRAAGVFPLKAAGNPVRVPPAGGAEVPVVIMQNAPIAGQCAARGVGDDLAGGQDTVLQRHIIFSFVAVSPN